jgi:thioredoxin 1
MALQITDDNAKELIAGDKLVVIDFWATWCGPCQRMSPIVEELAKEYEGRAVIGKYNVDEGEDLVAQYGIRNIPVLLFLKGGELVNKIVGAAPKAQVAEEIEKNL